MLYLNGKMLTNLVQADSP